MAAMKKRKMKKTDVRRMIKQNPKVDPKVVGESMKIIGYARKVGVRNSGLTVRGVSESRLKVQGPLVHNL